jgi:hypothetical protein
MKYIRQAAMDLYPEFDYVNCEDGGVPHAKPAAR